MRSSREHLATSEIGGGGEQCIMEDTKIENIKGIIWLHTASGGELVIALFIELRRCKVKCSLT